MTNKQKLPDYRDYMRHRKDFWKQKQEEEERRFRLFGPEH